MSNVRPIDAVLAFTEWLNNDEGIREAGALLEAAYAQLARDPRSALSLADSALARLDSLAIPERFEHARTRLRGRAWRERANALRALGRFHEAISACRESLALLDTLPPVMSDRWATLRCEALARHQLGERGEPLRMIREGLALFASMHERTEVLRSRIYEGQVEFDTGNFSGAERAFTLARADALALHEEESLAHIESNLGQCAQMLGRPEDALAHFQRALALFDAHGMRAERPRVRWGVAHLLADRGSLDAAVSEFLRTSSEFLEVSMPVHAALASLDLLDVLVLAGRSADVYDHATALLHRFADARMTSEAFHAFALVQMSAKGGRVGRKRIEELRQRLLLLEMP